MFLSHFLSSEIANTARLPRQQGSQRQVCTSLAEYEWVGCIYEWGVYYGGVHALETITMALEDAILEESQVRAAAIWFMLHAPGIYRCCLKREERDPSVRGPLWTSRPKEGYSIARWMFWRERLAEMRDRPKVEEETAHICRDAIQEMDHVSKWVNRAHIVERNIAFLQKMIMGARGSVI